MDAAAGWARDGGNGWGLSGAARTPADRSPRERRHVAGTGDSAPPGRWVPFLAEALLVNSVNHRRPRALLVDDDPVVLHVLSAMLDECGIDTERVTDGRAGLQVVADQLPGLDLLVTDLVMPGLTGDALVLAVRELGGERPLPILVVSCYLDQARAGALRLAGADAVVDKCDGLAPVVAAARALLARCGRLAPPGVEPEGAPVPLFRIELTRRG